MSTVFYPGMGVDIVTPLLCISDVCKIVATGPIPHTKFGKGALDKTMQFICNLVLTGNNEFYEGRNVDDDHFIEFLVEEGVILKKYNFKKKKMFLIQFKYNEKVVNLYYYYNTTPEAKKEDWPFKDQFDYVIHKEYKLNVHSPKINFMKNVKPLLKENTKLISDKGTLRGIWHVPKNKVPKEPIQSYQFVVNQTKYRSEGPFQKLFIVDIHDAIDASNTLSASSSSSNLHNNGGA